MSLVHRLRLVTGPALLGTLFALGCGQQQAAQPQTTGDTVVVGASPIPEQPAAPKPETSGGLTSPGSPQPQPKPPEPPPAFTFPTDTSGQAVAKVVTPQPPAAPTLDRFGQTATSRTPPARVVNPEAIGKVTYIPPAITSGKPAGLRPAAPAERLPLTLGVGAEGVPAKPTMPETPGITTKAKDVNIPPELPPLARPLPDRASLDDPTAEPGNAVIVNRSERVPLIRSGFLRVALPDPFELADQVKPRVAPAAEPGVFPVPVNPQRPQ